MTAPVLPLGTYVIYFGSIRDEYAESYSVQGLCDCQLCATPNNGQPRYRLLGEHVRWDHHSRTWERVGGPDLTHVDAAHVLPSPDGPEPWQSNQQTLRELGVPAPDWI